MSKVVELIILGVGALIYFTGFQTAVYEAINDTLVAGDTLGEAMLSIITIVPYLVFIFLGLAIAFPGALKMK
jgi:hypothetical protein